MSGINGEGLKAKQRYTPGIWTVSIHDDNGEKVIRSSHDDGIVANLECDSYTKSSQEIEANAALIAAAPEALEACQEALKLIEVARQYFPKSIKNADKFKLESVCALLGSAIAKTEVKL